MEYIWIEDKDAEERGGIQERLSVILMHLVKFNRIGSCKKKRVEKRMEKLETTIFLTFDNVLLHLGDFF